MLALLAHGRTRLVWVVVIFELAVSGVLIWVAIRQANQSAHNTRTVRAVQRVEVTQHDACVALNKANAQTVNAWRTLFAVAVPHPQAKDRAAIATYLAVIQRSYPQTRCAQPVSVGSK